MEKAVGTPLWDFIRAYRDRNVLRLHMPGHKGAGETEALDLTEVQGLPPLYPAEGIVRESEDIAARIFGAGRTVYSAEGSSLCIRAMLCLVRKRAALRGIRPRILAGRNAHRSFLFAAGVLGMEVSWLRGEDLLTCRLSGAELRAALAREADPPAAVYLTSPDYLGNRADIRELARVCRGAGVPLLVDNAHGAYLRFLPEDAHPLTLGADMTCDSAHKTLPVLTGGAYLQISREADPFFAEQAEGAMALFASTSPSWLILQSLDRCNALLAGDYRRQLADFADRTEALKDRLRARGYRLAGTEPLKITLEPRSRGYTGDDLHALLRRQGIECEFSDPDELVMMLTPATGEAGLTRLEEALDRIPRREPLPEARPSLPAPAPAMPLAEALLAPAERIPAEEARGRILADPCVSCPPAVPILVSGERIGEEALRCFAYYGIRSVSCVRESGAEGGRRETDGTDGLL